MQVVINIDEAQFKDIVESNIKDIPKEKVHEIILEGIRNYIDKDMVSKLFVESSSWSGIYPTSYLREVVKSSVPEHLFVDLAEELVAQLRENYDKVLREAIIDLLLQGMFRGDSFHQAVREVLMRMNNN